MKHEPQKIMAQIERWLRAGWIVLLAILITVQVVRYFDPLLF